MTFLFFLTSYLLLLRSCTLFFSLWLFLLGISHFLHALIFFHLEFLTFSHIFSKLLWNRPIIQCIISHIFSHCLRNSRFSKFEHSCFITLFLILNDFHFLNFCHFRSKFLILAKIFDTQISHNFSFELGRSCEISHFVLLSTKTWKGEFLVFLEKKKFSTRFLWFTHLQV